MNASAKDESVPENGELNVRASANSVQPGATPGTPSIHSLGGKARAESMTAEQRSTQASNAAKARWQRKKPADDFGAYWQSIYDHFEAAIEQYEKCRGHIGNAEVLQKHVINGICAVHALEIAMAAFEPKEPEPIVNE